ncbi:hypothetical protein PVAP13_8KG357902 [Panicum virgatum]|uniref:Uncharacterized protein n=1 Tax=Panicum virgatum TaxID=38727 RepID=A0A8T0PIX2_PANVG|nr:hypothetical protein PVAP13_8KG357902 [Panicum virgatum]
MDLILVHSPLQRRKLVDFIWESPCGFAPVCEFFCLTTSFVFKQNIISSPQSSLRIFTTNSSNPIVLNHISVLCFLPNITQLD